LGQDGAEYRDPGAASGGSRHARPFQGLGKPEPLEHLLAGCWSRRITQEHRLVYSVSDESVRFLQARYHY